MIKLYNKTKYPDDCILPVLQYAARKMRARGTTVVKITPSRKMYPRAWCKRGRAYIWSLANKWITGDSRYKMPKCDNGWIGLSLPYTVAGLGNIPIDAAQWFLHCALHEMGHVRDIRDNRQSLVAPRTASGRRIAHRKRPEEISVENQLYEYEKRKSVADQKLEDDLVLRLAIELDKK